MTNISQIIQPLGVALLVLVIAVGCTTTTWLTRRWELDHRQMERIHAAEMVNEQAQAIQHHLERASFASYALVALNLPYSLAGQEYHNTPSIGAALFGELRNPVEELLRQADHAMYQAKAAGRNTLYFCNGTV